LKNVEAYPKSVVSEIFTNDGNLAPIGGWTTYPNGGSCST